MKTYATCLFELSENRLCIPVWYVWTSSIIVIIFIDFCLFLWYILKKDSTLVTSLTFGSKAQETTVVRFFMGTLRFLVWKRCLRFCSTVVENLRPSLVVHNYIYLYFKNNILYFKVKCVSRIRQITFCRFFISSRDCDFVVSIIQCSPRRNKCVNLSKL